MIQNVLRAIGGVGMYGVISVCLFFTVFSTAVIWALIQKRSLLNSLSAIPLDDGTVSSKATKKDSHE